MTKARLSQLVQHIAARPRGEALPYLALEHLEGGLGRLLRGVELSERLPAETGMVEFAPGDVLFGKLRSYQAKSWLADREGLASSELVVMRPGAAVDARWLACLVQSRPFVDWSVATSQGVKMPRTSWEALRSMLLDLPSLARQQATANFLDAETGRIDGLIEKRRRMVQLLGERLDAVARRALHGDMGTQLSTDGGRLARTPDPRGWTYLKHIALIKRGRFAHRPRNDPVLYGGRYPFIQTGDIAQADRTIDSYSQTLNEAGRAVSELFPAGTLAMAIAANIGDVALLAFEACFPDSIVAFSPRPGVLPAYLFHLLRVIKPELLSTATLNTQLNVNVDRIGEIPVPWLPLEEQERITAHLDRDLAKMRTVEGAVAAQIALLRERRQALITAAVSGELDVGSMSA